MIGTVVVIIGLSFLANSSSFFTSPFGMRAVQSSAFGRNFLKFNQVDSSKFPVMDTKALKSSVSRGVSDADNISAMRILAASAICDLEHVQKVEWSSQSSLVHCLFKLYTSLDWAAVAASDDDNDMFSKVDLNEGCVFSDAFKKEFQKLQDSYVRVMNVSDKVVKRVKPHHLWSTAKHRKLLEIEAVGDQDQLGDGIRVGDIVFAREDLFSFVNATIHTLRLI